VNVTDNVTPLALPPGARIIKLYVKPNEGDVLVHRDGTRRTVLRRVDHCSGTTSIKLDNPNLWVFDALWYVRFHQVKIEENGETR
jgi:hypothetical protein